MISLSEWNCQEPEEAIRMLTTCCPSEQWATTVARRRPFSDVDDLVRAAREAWDRISPEEWLELFASHDRIAAPETATLADHSRDEQAAVYSARASVRSRLAAAAWDYEQHVGFMFITYAQGRSAEDVLSEVDRRMSNPRELETAIAQAQHRLIAEHRLRQLLGAPNCAPDANAVHTAVTPCAYRLRHATE